MKIGYDFGHRENFRGFQQQKQATLGFLLLVYNKLCLNNKNKEGV